jgi:hypothetical protein
MSQLTNLKKAQARLESEREDLARRERLLKRQARKLSARVARDAERLVGRVWFELMKTGQPADTETMIATATALAYVNEADGLLEVIDRLKPQDAEETGTGPEDARAPSAEPEVVPGRRDADDMLSGFPAPERQPVATTAPAPLPLRRPLGQSLPNTSSAASPALDGAGTRGAKT